VLSYAAAEQGRNRKVRRGGERRLQAMNLMPPPLRFCKKKKGGKGKAGLTKKEEKRGEGKRKRDIMGLSLVVS